MPVTKVDFNKMRSVVFFALIIGLSIAMLHIFRPFFYPLFWAAVMAVMFYPWYQTTNRFVGLPSVSAFITCVMILVVIFLPLTLIGLIIYYQSVELYNAVAQGLISTNVENIATWLADTPLAPYIRDIQSDWITYATNATQTLSLFLFRNVTSITQNFVLFIAQLFITFYTLYYFLKDGKRILERVMHISPLGDQYETLLYERFTSTTRATLKGSLIIGGIQGLLGGILFSITGVQGPIIWGLIMMILSLIPGIGAFLVWLPAGVIMLAMGNIWQGVTILLAGAFVISLIDNILRPPLVGKDTQMHPLIVLFSTLGGIVLFGISGFIIGPIIAALFLSVVTIYDFYYKKELGHNE